MGHLGHHKAHRDLQARLDQLSVTLPDCEESREILALLFSPEDAALVARLPLRPRSARSIAARLGEPEARMRRRLEQLADRGLVLDLHDGETGVTYYAVAPPVIGFFEFSLMRRDARLDQAALARTYERLFVDGEFLRRNMAGVETQQGRALVHEPALEVDQVSELLVWERATGVVEDADQRAVCLCYCRHKAEHLGQKCHRPLETCLTLDAAADYGIRHGRSRPIERAEALEILARTREDGQVHIADTVQRRVSYICTCCGCCCEQLRAINQHGLDGAVKTSAFIAVIDRARCRGCARCARQCPVQAIHQRALPPHVRRKARLYGEVDERVCLGCGVCQPVCRNGALTMQRRPERVLTPEATLERNISMALERGKLQHLIFDDHFGPAMPLLAKLTGAVLRMPLVRRALLSDALKSRFIGFLAAGYRRTEEAGKLL